jgi:hypothetical protein
MNVCSDETNVAITGRFHAHGLFWNLNPSDCMHMGIFWDGACLRPGNGTTGIELPSVSRYRRGLNCSSDLCVDQQMSSLCRPADEPFQFRCGLVPTITLHFRKGAGGCIKQSAPSFSSTPQLACCRCVHVGFAWRQAVSGGCVAHARAVRARCQRSIAAGTAK